MPRVLGLSSGALQNTCASPLREEGSMLHHLAGLCCSGLGIGTRCSRAGYRLFYNSGVIIISSRSLVKEKLDIILAHRLQLLGFR